MDKIPYSFEGSILILSVPDQSVECTCLLNCGIFVLIAELTAHSRHLTIHSNDMRKVVIGKGFWIVGAWVSGRFCYYVVKLNAYYRFVKLVMWQAKTCEILSKCNPNYFGQVKSEMMLDQGLSVYLHSPDNTCFLLFAFLLFFFL